MKLPLLYKKLFDLEALTAIVSLPLLLKGTNNIQNLG